MKKHKVLLFIVVVIVMSVPMCIADSIHQDEYEEIRQGYSLMEQGEYQAAEVKFSNALTVHKSELYWALVERINGVDSYLTKDNINNALIECLRQESTSKTE